MKIAIFSASGGIGRFAVKHALGKGWFVNAYVRNPAKLSVTVENLNVIRGELTDYESVKNTVSGCDAVI